MAGPVGSILVAAVGRLKTPHWQAAQTEYAERLTRYTDFAIREVKDVTGRGETDEVAQRKEGEQLLEATSESRARIALIPGPPSLDSPGLARQLESWLTQFGRLALLLGGPTGLSPEVRRTATAALSLSALTFPHELARVILLEQLYRAFTILRGERYHK